MLLAEPPPTPYDLRFSLFGIPVRVHPFFWLVALMFGANAPLDLALSSVAALFLAILGHEFGHAIAFRLYGYHPMITLHGLGGLTSPGPAVTCGARRLRPWDNILISFAGPAAGFLLAAALYKGLALTGHPMIFEVGLPYGVTAGPRELVGSLGVTFFIIQFLHVCVSWGIINLLPIFPLDGGQITREILVLANPRDGSRQALILSILTGGLMAFVAAVQWQSWFAATLFGYLAFESYMLLQSYSGRGPW